MLLGQSEDAPKRVRALAATYAAFLKYAFDPEPAVFTISWGLTAVGSMSRGPKMLTAGPFGLWALLLGRSPHWSSQAMAEQLFLQALPAVSDFTSPRAWAFSLIGIHEYLRHSGGDCSQPRTPEDLTNKLVTIFDKVASPDWTWFEDGLAYDNAKLAHALIVSGRATGQTGVYERGIQALRWLVGVQTSTRWTTPAHWQQRLLSAQRRTRRFRPAAHRGAEHNLGLPGGIPRNRRLLVV